MNEMQKRVYDFIHGHGVTPPTPTMHSQPQADAVVHGQAARPAGPVHPAAIPANYAEGGKVERVMHEFKHGDLHSGSKHGPMVASRKQAIAIALAEARKQMAGGYAQGGLVNVHNQNMQTFTQSAPERVDMLEPYHDYPINLPRTQRTEPHSINRNYADGGAVTKGGPANPQKDPATPKEKRITVEGDIPGVDGKIVPKTGSEGPKTIQNGAPGAPRGYHVSDLEIADFVQGGPVSGPGTPTSDSIPANLSDGEYVIPADVVAFLGEEAFNRLVDQTHQLMQNGGAGQQNPWFDLASDEGGSEVTQPLPSHPNVERREAARASTEERARREPVKSEEAMSGHPKLPPQGDGTPPGKTPPATPAARPAKPHPPTKQAAPVAAHKGSITNAAPLKVAY